MPVFQSLYLGRPEDAIVLEAAAGLEQMARGSWDSPVSSDERAQAVTWTALWRLAHGQADGAGGAVAYLESQAARGYHYDGWINLIEVLRHQAEGDDVRDALLRLDSTLSPLPLPLGPEWSPLPVEVQNLMLARLLSTYGEYEQALQAIRRRPHTAPFLWLYASLPEYLREEGRLAAVVGDTAGAIRAYEHYLALREDPDPPWRAQWDSVKAELEALAAQ